MELVYLWVDDYKNIKKQGFNFSPRFNCEYNGKNELIICDKKKKECKDNDYIPDFFGENINITAIVGENGSGKSGVLECCIYAFELFFQSNYNSKKLSVSKHKNIENFTNYIFIIKFNDKFYNLGDKHINGFINAKDAHKEIRDSLQKQISIHFSDSTENYYINESLVLNVQNSTKQLSVEELLDNLQYVYELVGDIFSPTILIFDFYNYYKEIENLKNNDYKFNNILKNILDIEFEKIANEYREKLLFKTLVNKDSETVQNYILHLKKSLTNTPDLKDKLQILHKLEALSEIEQYIEKKVELPVTCNEVGSYTFTLELNKLDNLNEYRKLFMSLSVFAVLKIYDNTKNELAQEYSLNLGISFESLSSGEKTLLKKLLLLKNTVRKVKEKNIKNLLFFLDEPDLTLHPSWQKRLINYVLMQVQNTGLNIKFVITSHSPFILSDLPKENVIFLKKGKQVKGTEKKQTFGANIHTLLSDSFFMEDGLMGEFAKGKIEEVIRYLNYKDSTIKNNDEAQKLLNIIGEPIIKNQLQKMLDSKRLSKIDEIDNVKLQIEELTNRLDKLQHD